MANTADNNVVFSMELDVGKHYSELMKQEIEYVEHTHKQVDIYETVQKRLIISTHNPDINIAYVWRENHRLTDKGKMFIIPDDGYGLYIVPTKPEIMKEYAENKYKMTTYTPQLMYSTRSVIFENPDAKDGGVWYITPGYPSGVKGYIEKNGTSLVYHIKIIKPSNDDKIEE